MATRHMRFPQPWDAHETCPQFARNLSLSYRLLTTALSSLWCGLSFSWVFTLIWCRAKHKVSSLWTGNSSSTPASCWVGYCEVIEVRFWVTCFVCRSAFWDYFLKERKETITLCVRQMWDKWVIFESTPKWPYSSNHWSSSMNGTGHLQKWEGEVLLKMVALIHMFTWPCIYRWVAWCP